MTGMTTQNLSQNFVTDDTCDDFVIDNGGYNIRLENSNIVSNLECKVSHIEPS